jgi:hypothetical protein
VRRIQTPVTAESIRLTGPSKYDVAWFQHMRLSVYHVPVQRLRSLCACMARSTRAPPSVTKGPFRCSVQRNGPAAIVAPERLDAHNPVLSTGAAMAAAGLAARLLAARDAADSVSWTPATVPAHVLQSLQLELGACAGGASPQQHVRYAMSSCSCC